MTDNLDPVESTRLTETPPKRVPRRKSTVEPTQASAPETPSPEFIKIKEPESKFENLRKKAIERILENRNKPEPVHVPPPQTPRMILQTEREMEAGRKRVAYNKEQGRLNPAPRPEPDGRTVSVFRPQDYVPNMDSKTDQERGVKAL